VAILSDPPEWRVPGQKPPQNIIEVLGWEVASHPPAPWFNWFFHRVFESLLELESATLARVVNEAGVPSIMAGPESERPAASQETVGRIYIATDTKRMFRDRGNGWDLLNTPDAIGAETPDGAQQKADAAAASALSSALAYTDSAVAAHANRTDNPHGVTKAQVGLGSVENYGVAAQAEAEAGTVNNKYMTPLRTKQAIDALAVNRSALDAHANATSVHGATSSPTASRLVIRDANGRARFADPVNAQDAATKAWVEGTCYLQSQWGRSVATAGYIRFPNGIILQWGTSPSGSSGSVSVTFPIAFPNVCLGAVTSKASGSTYEAVTTGYSKTGMTVVNNPEGLNTGRTRYFAIGY